MPAIGVSTSTLHKWAARGYIYLGSPGTGKSVTLTGKEILYAATLNLISVSGGSIKWQYAGLQDCVSVYYEAFKKCLPYEKPSTKYCVYKFVDDHAGNYAGVAITAEWEISENPMNDRYHIVEATGSKAEPFFSCIDLEELLRSLVLKIEGRQV